MRNGHTTCDAFDGDSTRHNVFVIEFALVFVFSGILFWWPI